MLENNEDSLRKKVFLKSLNKFLEKKNILEKGLMEKKEHLMARSRYYTLEKFSFNSQLSIAYPYLSKYLTEKIHEK